MCRGEDAEQFVFQRKMKLELLNYHVILLYLFSLFNTYYQLLSLRFQRIEIYVCLNVLRATKVGFQTREEVWTPLTIM